MSSRIAYQLRTVAWWLREISEAYHNQVKGIIQRYGKIHDYESVNLEKIWQVVEKELPSVKSALEKILPPLDQLEREIN